MQCPQCGINIANPGSSCPACHASMLVPCPHCMFKNLVGQQICGHCQADLSIPLAPGLAEAVAPTDKGPGELVHYPVLSVELMHLDKLEPKLKNKAQLTRLVKDLMIRLENQLVSQEATIESVRDNMLFFSFRQGNTLGHVLAKAIKVSVALAKKVISIQGVNLMMRVGLDVVNGSDRGPMSSVPERLVAKPGEVIVSHNVYKILNRRLPFETVGPIRVQGEMQTFFRIPMKQPAVQSQQQAKAAPPRSEPAAVMEAPTPQQQPAAQDFPDERPGLANEAPTIERKIEPPELPGEALYIPPQYIALSPGETKPGSIGYMELVGVLHREIESLVHSPDAQGQIVALCAPPGYGKTSIINLARSQLPEDAVIPIGGSFYQYFGGDSFPFYYWLEFVQNLMGFPLEGAPQEPALEHLGSILKQMFGDNIPPDIAEFVGTMLNLTPLQPISGSIREQVGQVVYHLAQLLTNLAQLRPVMLIMEDLQYADTASLELLLQLFQNNILASRIMIVMTYTPDVVFTGALQQAVTLFPFTEHVVQSLSEEEIIQMAEPPLAVPWKKLPDNLRAMLVEKGTPFFLEEAFRLLQMSGGFEINDKTGKYSPTKNIKKVELPEDLHELIIHRFMHLSDAGRAVLQLASVLGMRFSSGVLAELTQMGDKFEEVLRELWQAGFFVPDMSVMLRFRHHMLWQIAYDSIEPSNRGQLHQVISQYYNQGRAHGVCMNPALIALQAERGNDLPLAIETWGQTAVWMANVGSVIGANMVFNHMLNLMREQGNLEVIDENRIYQSLAVLNIDANPEYAKNLFLTVIPNQTTEGHAAQIELQVFLSQAYERLGSFQHAVSTIHRAIGQLPEGNESERVALGSLEVWYLWQLGNNNEALMVYDQEVKPYLEKASPAPYTDPDLRSSYFKGELGRAYVYLMQCDPRALEIIEHAVAQCEINDEPSMAMQFRLARGMGYLMKGAYESCQRELEPLLDEIEQYSNRAELMVWWGLIVLIYHCDMGDWQNASLMLPNTSYQAEQAKDYLAWTISQDLAGRVAMERGSHGECQRLLENAVTVAAEYHLSLPALMGWRYIAENELAMDNFDVADQIVVQALQVAKKIEIHNLFEFYQLVVTRSKILLAQGHLKQAGQILEGQWSAIVKTGYTPLIADAALQISVLYGKLSQQLPEPHKSKYQKQQQNFLEKAKTIWKEQGNHYRLSPFQQTVEAEI